MPRYCEVRKVEINGKPATMLVTCSGNPYKEKCYICGRPAPFLCDGEIWEERCIGGEETVPDMRTCDRPICGYHAYMPNAFEDKHLCPECRARKEA